MKISLIKNLLIKIIFIFLLFFNSCNTKIEVDLIIHNGKIYSLDDNNLIYEAIAVKKDKILAVGKNNQILNKYKSNEKIDLKGKTMYPGFIDAHCHFLTYGLQSEMVDLSKANSFIQIIDILKKSSNQNFNQWLIGYGWDQNQWKDKDWPNNDLLNENFKNINVVLNRIDGHAIMANNAAIESAKINPDTITKGGYIEKIERKMTGLFIDNAMDLILSKIPKPNENTKKRALLKAQEDCFSLGLTTVDIAGLNKDDIDLIYQLHLTEELQIKIYAMLLDNEQNFKYYLDSLGKPFKSDKLNVRAFKFFADGSLGSRGACLLNPYNDQKKSYGMLLQEIKIYEKKLKRLKEFGFQACTHAIGDSTNRTVLKSYSKILEASNDLRWRVEHVQCISNKDLALLSEFNIIPSVQPTHATSDFSWALRRLGKSRLANCYRYHTLYSENNIIALGTDFPVEEINPINTFFAAVFRKNKDGLPLNGFQKSESLERLNALKGMTIWAALANFEEKEKGSIEIGKAADFVVLSNDILKVDENEILKTKVIYTIVDGNLVYRN